MLPSYGIRASDELGRGKIILKDGNYRVWSVVTKEMKLKVWRHIDGTAIRPPEARAVVAAVAGAPADDG